MMWRIAMNTKYSLATLVSGLCAAAAIAQPQTPPLPPEAPAPASAPLFVLGNLSPLTTMGGQIDFIRSEGGVPGPVIEGKPYSARAITESAQVLADGNRITQRNEAVVYRDSEGRTRREQTLTSAGQGRVGEPVTMINIHDPVTGKSYVLDAAERTAREIRGFQMAIVHARDQLEAAKAGAAGTWDVAVPGAPPVPAPAAGVVAVDAARGVDRGMTVIRQRNGGGDRVQVFSTAPVGAVELFPPGTTGMYEPAEELGEQVLEGLLVKGTRMTDTIPAGTIGNDRAIDIVTERWYSEDIDAMVLQRFSDPRFGETTYRLVNVVLGEPSPDLFQVPQGYELEAAEMPRAGVRVAPGAPGGAIQFQLQRTDPVRAE
jgi:hypothetical protein